MALQCRLPSREQCHMRCGAAAGDDVRVERGLRIQPVNANSLPARSKPCGPNSSSNISANAMPLSHSRRFFLSLALVFALTVTSGCGTAPEGGPLAPPSTLSGELSCVGSGAAPPTVPGAISRVYKSASGRELRAHVLEPASQSANRPAILFFFGGGWRRGTVTQFLAQAKAAAERGYVAVLADYRVSCRDNTTAVAAVEDARDAYAWLRREAAGLGVDPGQIVLAGGSAGGQLALVASLSADSAARPVALVLYNPAVDLVPLASWIGLQREEAAEISPSAMNLAASPPMLILHGDADRIVPIDTAREFCSKVRAAGGSCELHEYAGQGHGFFNSHAKGAQGLTPYDDTLARTFAFLNALGLQPPISVSERVE